MSVVYLTTSDDQPKLDTVRTQNSSTACTLAYLDEGGANFVFRLLPEPGYAFPGAMAGKLLRIRKDLSHVQSTTEQLRAFDQHFKPLFPPDNIIQHSLIGLSSSIPRMLNEYLRHSDRPSHRSQDFLSSNEDYGLLITDMSPSHSSTLLQLKPKWLFQSPNAPANAKRCRTCALRARRTSQNVRTATDKQASCPLALVSERIEARQRAAEAITEDVLLRAFIVHEAQPLLLTLRRCQANLDPDGVLDSSKTAVTSSNICKAMTLRDCTLFVRCSDTGVVDLRLGDLDLKQAKQMPKWKQMEQNLIDEGWYMHSEDSALRVEENICLLSYASF